MIFDQLKNYIKTAEILYKNKFFSKQNTVLQKFFKMKFILSIILLVTIYVSLSEAACSADNWKAASNVDITKMYGRWYTYKTYDVGHSDCVWHDLYSHPTKPDTATWSINIIYKNGTNINGVSTAADLSLLDPSITEGKLNVAMENGAIATKYVIAIEYDEFSFTRSCIDGVENFVVYLRNLYPSNRTVAKINKLIEENGIDSTKVITS